MQDTEVWSNYENVVGILETCFKYVMIDKALLATMLVIEHMSDRHYPRLPSPGRALKLKAIQDNIKATKQAEKEEISKKLEDKVTEEKLSPSKAPKECKVHLEEEINEVFDDTSRLETELFATMEEKARLEDELIAMKDYVSRLKSDMFHLKIERTNLEKEVKKTAKNIVSLSDSSTPHEEQVNSNIMDGYRGLRVGELSDVTEASHESNSGESENGSQVSEGNEQSSQVLKNCLASMAQMYTLMPNQDDDTLTEGNDSDEKDASLSEDDISDSDEDDIIITKIARGILDYHSPATSPTKSKKSDGASRKSDGVSSKGENSKTVQSGQQLGKKAQEKVQAQRTQETFKDLQIAYEDLEDELYHVRGQLSKAQQIILSLESKLKEEKENWEQIRKLYLEYKDKNDVLEGKVGILREELEKSLRENTFLKDYHQVDIVREGQAKSHPHSSRSPTRSPSKRKVFDLRNIPSISNSNREIQIINLLEENTELKTYNDQLTQEKVLVENLSKEKDLKVKGLEMTIRFLEEEKETLKEEIETIHRRKFKPSTETQERLTLTEVDIFSKECAHLEKELAMERNLAAKIKSDNQTLTKDLEKMEAELERWRTGLVASGHIQDEDLTPTNERAENSKEKWSRNQNNAFQTVFIDDDFGSEDGKVKDTGEDSNEETKEELQHLNNQLQREMLSMSEYQEALEKEYGEVKEESEKFKKELQTKEETIKSLENEITSIKKQGSTKQSDNHGNFFSRLNMRTSPSKLKSAKEEFDFHNSKKDDHTYQDYKKFEDEINALKRDNTELRQQITKSEQKIAIYAADLEKAMLKIRHLQEERINRGGKADSVDNKFAKTIESSGDGTKPTAANYLASSDAKLCKTTKEIERLKEQLQDKEAEKGLLYDELHMIRRRKDELDKALDEAREARTELQEKMDQMAKCTHFEDSVKELTERNQKLATNLQQSEDLIKTLTKKHEQQNENLKMIEQDLVSASGEKLKGDFELRNFVLEMEKAKNDLLQSEQERKMLSVQLNEKIELSTNLEIQLMELKCANECMKSEMEQMKEKKRMENHQNQEKNITRETMEKRLHEAFKTNNHLQSEIQSTKEENNDLNEKLSKATKDRELLEEKAEKFKVNLDNSAAEKKQFESKTKKLEETKKRMEEDLKRLKDNITSLQGDLQRVEKQQEESTKKNSNLEKELRRKNKELENKIRENRRLKKDLSAMKETTNTENEQDTGTEVSEVKELRERVEELEKENEDLYARLANVGGNKQQENTDKSKRVTFHPSTSNSQLSSEIGWDFETETLSEEKDDIHEKQEAKHNLSEEVGWDLTESVEDSTDDGVSNDSVSLQTDEESIEHQSNTSEQGNMPTIKEDPTETVHFDEQASMAQICKEKLLLESKTAQLLESKTSYLTKTQMNLENALSKALKENKHLVDKLHDSQIILQRIKSRVQKLEEQTNVNVVLTNVETQTAAISSSTSTGTQIGEARLSDSDTSPITEKYLKEFTGEAESPTKAGVTASSSKAIVYLTREKKQIAKELEALKQKHEDINQKLTQKEVVMSKLEQELNFVTIAYEKERESLLHDLEVVKKDYNIIKDKLKSQEEFQTSCEDIKQNHLEAERLVTELEKDLMRQTDEKNILKKELQDSRNKLTKVDALEQELQHLRNENRQVEATMGKQLEQYRKENNELSEKLEKRKKSWKNGSTKKTVHGKKRENIEKKSLNNEDKRITEHDQSLNEVTESEFETSQDTSGILYTTNTSGPCFEEMHQENDQVLKLLNVPQEKSPVEVLKSFNIPRIVITGPDSIEIEVVIAPYNSDINESLNKQAELERVEAKLSANHETCSFDSKNTIETIETVNKQLPVNTKAFDIVEVTETSDQGKDSSTTKPEDTASEQGFETDEEANIEEKLVRILKERQTMELEVQLMVQEITTLKKKLSKIQLEHENSAEQENTGLRKQLKDLANEKKNVDTQVSEMKTRNAQLEIELSDAAEMKQVLEVEIMRLRESSQEISNTEKIEYAEKCEKLEEVLSKVVEENSNLYKEISCLREENRKLQTNSILEIADGSTQVSPTAFEDENRLDLEYFNEMKKKGNQRHEEMPIINVSSPGFHDNASHSPIMKPSLEHGFSTKDMIKQDSRNSIKDQVLSRKYRLQLPVDPNMKPFHHQTLPDSESKPLSASSPDLSCAAEERVPSSNSGEYLENQQHVNNGIVSPESESGYGGSKGGNTLCSSCRQAACQCQSLSRRAAAFSTGNDTEEATDLLSTESVYGSISQEVCTDSSFASVTDFEDISFSSDWVSTEDLRAGHVTARGYRGMSKMHRELAEIKCTNTILENELTILRNRNTDYQSQLQKQAGKNNSLKQKLCERSMIAKKAEREIGAITEEKMRLEVQIASAKEEFNRVEREKSKFERSLANTKSENKRLKSDLVVVKTENYKNMKQLVKLEAENKKLMSELEESREELKNVKELLTNFDNASLTSLDERLSCESPELNEGVMFGLAAASSYDGSSEATPKDRSGLSLELKKSSSHRQHRVSSDQSFPRYHCIAEELVHSSVCILFVYCHDVT